MNGQILKPQRVELWYIWQSLEIQNDLKLYKEKQIEPTFFEIVKPNLKNKIVGRIYKYPNAPITEFT